MPNPLVKCLLISLDKTGVTPEMKPSLVVYTTMTTSIDFQLFPALRLICQKHHLEVITGNAVNCMIPHKPLSSICIGLSTVTSEQKQRFTTRSGGIQLESLHGLLQRVVETADGCRIWVAYAEAGVCLKARSISIPVSTKFVEVERWLGMSHNAIAKRLRFCGFTTPLIHFPNPLLPIWQHLIHNLLESCCRAWVDQ